MTDTTEKTTIRKSMFLPAPRKRVWAFLTDPEHMARWFHRPSAPLRENTRWEVAGRAGAGGPMMWGKVRVARPHEFLEYTFQIPPLGNVETVVRWHLDPVAGGTRLSLEHVGLPEGEAAFGLLLALDEGWDAHLASLRANAPEEEVEGAA